MPFVIVDDNSIIYDDKTEQVAMFISRKAANVQLSKLLTKLPSAEIVEVQVEKKR